MKTTIYVKCTDESVEFDTAELPTVTVEFAFNYGLKQWVNDGAAKQRDKYDSDAEYEAARVAGANERIERLRSGDVPGTRVPASPTKKMFNTVVTKLGPDFDPSKVDMDKLVKYLERQAAEGRAA